jgi:hypothetical protein
MSIIGTAVDYLNIIKDLVGCNKNPCCRQITVVPIQMLHLILQVGENSITMNFLLFSKT